MCSGRNLVRRNALGQSPSSGLRGDSARRSARSHLHFLISSGRAFCAACRLRSCCCSCGFHRIHSSHRLAPSAESMSPRETRNVSNLARSSAVTSWSQGRVCSFLCSSFSPVIFSREPSRSARSSISTSWSPGLERTKSGPVEMIGQTMRMRTPSLSSLSRCWRLASACRLSALQ